MTINVSAWSIRNPTPAILLFLLLSLAGLMSFRAMNIQNFPDISLPTVTVTASLAGASPAHLESEVARTLEDALSSLQGVKHIRTLLSDGSASITVEFRLEKPIQDAVDEVRDAVSRARADLPADLRDPIIKKVDSTGAAILTYTLAAPQLDAEALSWFIDNQVSRALQAVPGVGSVSRVGGASREVLVELDPTQLLARNLSAADISRQLRQVQQDASGGRSEMAGAEQSVRTLASVQSAEELAHLELALGDGRHIRLGQVARVQDTTAEPRTQALLDGQVVVGFEVMRAIGASEINVADAVRLRISQLQAAHPNITFTEALNQVAPVQENYQGSMNLLYEGALLAVLVVFLFLRDWRATLVSAVALPLSAIPTFALMHWMGFTLNTVTLLSLSLMIGVLVDDAIVEIENIMRHLRMGKTPYQAAMEAADEIGLAVIATTLTLIAVFLPTAFMGGIPGKFFVQFGWTAAIAVFFSLLVARMLTPMMAAYLLKPPQHAEPEPSWMRLYLQMIHWCLQHRIKTLAAAAVFFVGSFALVPLLPTGFMPADDEAQIQITLTLPPGSRLHETHALAEQARTRVQQNPQVKQVYTAIGGSTSGGGPFAQSGAAEVRTAVLTVNINHRNQRPGLSQQAVEAQLREALSALPGVRIKVGNGDEDNYLLVLAGDNGPALNQHAQQLQRELRSLPGIGAVTSSASLVQPELIIRPDFARAADLGVTSADIAETLRIATSGDYSQALAKLNLSERQIPIVVRLTANARADLTLLKRLPVPTARGPIALEQIATLELGSGPADISRTDRKRTINIEVELNGRSMDEVEHAAQQLPALRQLPPGISQSTEGDAEKKNELFASFGLAMATGVLCIYLVLVLLFKDFIQPATILAALILSIPGAFLALFITGSALSMPSMIGLIMLMGIATKNSILLIDYIILARREHHLTRLNAALDACHKRARPIIMTTLAMAAGMLPIALGLGADPSFRAPMAIVVVGGLITSTFLSLLVIPVVFTYVDDLVQWLHRGLRWGK
ncbi:MAG: hypothetical protein RL497_1341 [Pseudomonadota bacterium]|jgi:multidrug efflux pump subunit AcrB